MILGAKEMSSAKVVSGWSTSASCRRQIAMTDCVLLHIEKKALLLAMSLEPKLSALFVKYLLKRNIRVRR